MSKIKIFIKNSNIPDFSINKEYDIELEKCIGYGSYGFIFQIFNNLAIKLLLDPIDKFDDEYSDYNETDVINKIINNSEKIQVNCNSYCLGFIKKYRGKFKENEKIRIYVNREDTPVKMCSSISKNKSSLKFYIFENYPVIIMPYFTMLNEINVNSLIIRNEEFLCKIIDTLINSLNELLQIGLINLDLKINNAVLDKNDNLRFIDFGLIKNIDKINNKFENKVNYYIWPKEEIEIEYYLSYMICIFILEIYYCRVHNIKNNKNLLKSIIETFMKIDTISEEMKILLEETLLEKKRWNDFIDSFYKIKLKYDLTNIKVPYLSTF